MSGKKVGYIRVSSIAQNTERQLEGIDLDRTFTEKASAKTNHRPVLHECLTYLREDDELHVHSIDRLARNLMDLQTIVTKLNKEKISVHFHKEGLTFTGAENPMNKLMLQMMGAFAEFERNLIHERQAEGIASAKKRGVKFGKPAKLNDAQIKEMKEMATQRYNKTDIAKKFDVSRQTVYNILSK